MKKNALCFSLIFFLMVSLFVGLEAPREVSAEAVGDQLASKGCWRQGAYYGPGFAQFSCRYSPMSGGSSSINMPFPRVLDVSPENGLVNIPVALAVDWVPGTFGYSPFSTGLLYVAERARYTGFSSSLYVSSSDPMGTSDQVNLHVSSGSPYFELMVGHGDEWGSLVSKATPFEDTNGKQYGLLGRKNLTALKSTLSLSGETVKSPSNYNLGNNDALYYVVGLPLRSSMNAKGAAVFEGEKAYPIHFRTTWHVFAKVSWSSYEEYEWDHDDCHTTSRPGLTPGSDPIISTVCTPVYDWHVKGGAFNGNYVKAQQFDLDYVYDNRVRGYVSDYAYPVFQSQALLQDH